MSVRITTIAKNESDRFLPQLLPIWRQLGEVYVLIDGTSDDIDDTIMLAEAHDCTWKIYAEGWERGESPMRQFQFEWARKGADWLVHMDADHCPAGDFRPHLKGSRVAFYVYDMWGPDFHRHQPPWWVFRPWWHALKVSDLPDFVPEWNERPLHGGHLPQNRDEFGPIHAIPPECGLLHYAYATSALRQEKFDYYSARFDDLKPAERAQVNTILNGKVVCYNLGFEPTWSLDL